MHRRRPAYASTSPSTPNYLSFYEDALTANGIGYDVYDVDAMGRTAPDHLGVLGHYDAVIWYRGNDIHVREPGWGGGNVSRLAVDETLEVRQYLNEGGKLLYTGQWAGGTENGLGAMQFYDPVANQQCCRSAPAEVAARCLNWGDKNDFLQYYLGAYLYVSDAGLDDNGDPFPIIGVDEPFDGPPASAWTLGGGTGADNQVHNASFLATSGRPGSRDLPPVRERDPGEVGPPRRPVRPAHRRLLRLLPDRRHHLQAAGTHDRRARRRRHDVVLDLVRHRGRLGPRVRRGAHGRSGQLDHPARPQRSHDPGDRGELQDGELRRLARRCTRTSTTTRPRPEPRRASPTGTTGEWNAASGNSGGWQQWQVDLGGYAGQQVEVSISYASDWATQGLGVFVDDIEVSTGQGTTSFETGLDGWDVLGAPPGSSPNSNDFDRTTPAGFPEGPVAATADSLYFGFGFEGITDEADRNEVMGRAVGYLLD